ncbi:hypothetical protein C0Q70_00081 [Pomacea canaliculata]|uniref:G-protein coupled receptors family 2 profile 2 domain-containing protein n=1 Tax=Pomacea canaliculata TaxID=400727 RepID=A0A2T7PVS0_POMCA|nr:hypothetical protein C0Q70_00081 [Pomacea canaliculata]
MLGVSFTMRLCTSRVSGLLVLVCLSVWCLVVNGDCSLGSSSCNGTSLLTNRASDVSEGTAVTTGVARQGMLTTFTKISVELEENVENYTWKEPSPSQEEYLDAYCDQIYDSPDVSDMLLWEGLSYLPVKTRTMRIPKRRERLVHDSPRDRRENQENLQEQGLRRVSPGHLTGDMDTRGDVSSIPVRVHGEVEAYDRDVEDDCLKLSDIYRVTIPESRLQQNVFCAVCNGDQPRAMDCDYMGGRNPGLPPLSLLFGLSSDTMRDTTLSTSGCARGRETDFSSEKMQIVGDALARGFLPQGVCRNLTCPAGKLLDAENSTCSTALANIRGLTYKLNINLVPSTELALNTSRNESLRELVLQLQRQLENKTQNYAYEYVFTITLELFFSSSTEQAKIVKIMLTGDITSSREIKRDIAEGFLVQNLLIDDWILERLDFKENVTLIQHIDIESLQNTTTPTVDENVTVYHTNYRSWAEDALKGLYVLRTQRVRLLYALVKSALSRDNVDIPESLKIKMSPLLLCAYVQLSRDEFMIREGADGQKRLVVVSEHEEAELDSLLYVRLEDNEVLNVCIETLEALKYVPKVRSSPLWQHLLSWIAIPMSILCVVLTFAVYALLPALRTQPGLNVMGTCAALFVAQVALMLASNLQTSGVWCQALGILVHEAWLSVFCWMVVCSMHMFQVFSAKTRHESRSLIWKTTRNIAVSIALPAVVVALVVAVSYVQSKGESIGYSSESCFLSSQLLVGTAMVLPLTVIVVLNLVLFLLTVRRIHEVTKLKPHSDSRPESHQHVWVCARLSMLTGVMWTLSLLSEGLDLDWLRGLSILANGGQGVLLLISYATSRRVRMLLYARLGHRDDITSNTRSTTDKLSSTVVSTIHSLEHKP